MTSFIQARLKEIAKECGGNRAICEKSGVSERTFANWLAGSSEPKIIGISAIAHAAGVTIDWIITGVMPKQRLGSHTEKGANTILVPWLDKKLDDQSVNLSERLKVNDHIPFSKKILENRLRQKDFDYLCIIETTGDSMAPTINNSDLVLIDRNQCKLQDGVMAYAFKDCIYIKRILNVIGGIEVISDNKSLYPAHRIQGSDISCFEPIGRVIWAGKTLL